MKLLPGLILLLIFPVLLSAQNVQDDCHRSNEGTNFWFGFMEGRNYNPTHYLEISVSAREATTFSVYYGPDETPLVISKAVDPDSVTKVTLPWEQVEPIGSESIENKGIHLVSEKPVNVFALNYDKNSNDVATIFPVESLGNRYFAMCYTPSVDENSDGTYNNGRNSEFVIVAAENSTTVTITPSVQTDQLKPAGVPFSVTLNKGQVYQVQSKNHDNRFTVLQGDLTGSYIQADKNVAVYSGSLSAKIPVTTLGFWDHLYEQMPPLHAWGREFITVPLKPRQKDRYRILASEDNTEVTINNFGTYELNRGEFKEIVLNNQQPKRIYSEKPIMVAQYSLSVSEDMGTFAGENLEPFMVILSPVEQFRNSANFVVYQDQELQSYEYFVNAVTTTSEVSNLRLDGNPISNLFINLHNGYSFAWINLDPGVHNMWDINPDKGFTAYSYSYGYNVSYGFGVAFNLDYLLDFGENFKFKKDTLSLCYGDSLTLDPGPYYEKYRWSTADTTEKLVVKKEGTYSVTVTDINGCQKSDTINVYVSHPIINLGIKDTASCAPFSLTLDAGSGFTDYLWNTGEKTQKIIVNKTGRYDVTGTDIYGCTASDDMNLTVYPVPVIKFVGSHLICSDTTSLLQVNLTGIDSSKWDFDGSTAWSTDKPDLLAFSETTQTSTRITVKDWGDYKIFFDVSTTDSCHTSEQFNISFYKTPTSDFEFLDSVDCSDYDTEVKYIGDASENAGFYWDFGNSLPVDTLGWQDYLLSLGYGASPSVGLYVDEHGCRSPVFRKDITGNAIITVDANQTRGCDSLKVTFKGNLKVDDNVSYLWDFGDGAQGHSQYPIHVYSYPGLFNVGLMVTNQANNCRAAYSFKNMIKVFQTPKALFSANSNVCYGDTLPVVYLNRIDSSYCYWQFDGAHQLGNGNDSIVAILDAPLSNITLQVNEYGCFSKPVTKYVRRIPHIDFSADIVEGCQPLTVKTIGIKKDNDIIFTWMEGQHLIERGDSNLYFFQDTGHYDLGVIGYSQVTFCRDTVLKPDMVWVHQKPVAKYEVDHPIVYIDNPTIKFTNESKFGADYFWNFGDSLTSTQRNPIHYFSKLGNFNTRLIAESTYGCLDTTSLQVEVIPYSIFTPNAFRPDSNIPENKYFMPVEQGVDPNRFNLKIFNRWGQIIFESSDVKNKWDGTTKNARPAPMGNYIWTVNYYDVLGFEHNLKGQVLLIR